MKLQFECVVCGVEDETGDRVNTRFGCSWVCKDCFNSIVTNQDAETIKILGVKQRATITMLHHDWITNKNIP